MRRDPTQTLPFLKLLIEYGANIRSMRGKYHIMQEAALTGNAAVMDAIFSLAPDMLDRHEPP